MAQMQRRAPARMALSPKVTRGPAKTTSSEKPARARAAGPFGGMNRTDPGKLLRPPPQSSKHASSRSRGRGDKKGQVQQYKALKMQRALGHVSYGERSSTKQRISSVDSFDQFPLLPVVQDSIRTQALKGLENISPTPIQRLAIPALLGGTRRRSKKKAVQPDSDVEGSGMKQFLLAAETGSGKTLAYVLPIIDALKRAEAHDEDIQAWKELVEGRTKRKGPFELEAPPLASPVHPTTGRPFAIILLPTSELVAQVGAVVKELSHVVKFRAAFISAALTPKVIRSRLFSPGGIDILISTPHLLASIAEGDPNVLSRVRHMVVDEADSLFDRSFSPLTSAILDRATPALRQLVLCSATIPRSLDSFLRKRFPDMERLATPNLHAIPRRVQLGVVDIQSEPYHGNRNMACAMTIWTIGEGDSGGAAPHSETEEERAATKHIIVFVNERETTQEVAEYLVSRGIDAVALNRDSEQQRQADTLAEFTSSSRSRSTTAPSSAPSKKPSSASTDTALYTPVSAQSQGLNRAPPPPRRTLPNTKVLVATDLGSRGIDTLAVRHVILYDVPHTTIDFIHRLGRTGRMGRRGKGIVLVGKRDRKDIVKEVREGMYRGQALI